MSGKERREDRVSIDKRFPIFQIASFLLGLVITAATVTNWSSGEHAETNKQVAINSARIDAESEARGQDRALTMQFYSSIESKVSSIEHMMIRKEKKADDFMMEVLKVWPKRDNK